MLEQELREKLEALYNGAATPGEKEAARCAAVRLREKL